MTKTSLDLNDVVQFAFAKSVWISKEHKKTIEDTFSNELVARLDSALHCSCWPPEPWTTAKSFKDAADKVIPVLKNKFPELNDDSIQLIMNYACYQWK